MSLADQMVTDITGVFLSTGDFADSAVWGWLITPGTPPVYGSKPISGIFDNVYNAVDLNGNPVDGSVPVFKVASAEVDGIARGDTLTRNTETWYITGVQPDGTGMTDLILSEDAP